jgi:hypothetical protein
MKIHILYKYSNFWFQFKDRPEREIYRPGRNRVRQQSQNQPPIIEEEG